MSFLYIYKDRIIKNSVYAESFIVIVVTRYENPKKARFKIDPALT